MSPIRHTTRTRWKRFFFIQPSVISWNLAAIVFARVFHNFRKCLTECIRGDSYHTGYVILHSSTMFVSKSGKYDNIVDKFFEFFLRTQHILHNTLCILSAEA